jgi:undecaprenyl diphosphate synthase
MDGNGRWAEKRGLERIEGHRAGVEVVRTVIQYCIHKQINVLSLFAFSSENWARPAMEVEFLMQLFLSALKREVAQLHKEGVRVRFTGDRSQLSPALCAEMLDAEALTAKNKKLILNFALNYGGKWDIVQAAKQLASEVARGSLSLETVDESMFASFLATNDLPEPDLFIRTSGEQRISNFFLWQLAYTELYFSNVYWPDFTAEEFEKILTCFSTRKRRYGQTEKQLHEKGYV